MHEELWQQLAKLDCEETAQRAGCRFLRDPERYIITFLSNEYVVNLNEKKICSNQSDNTQVEAGFLEQLCLLAYLINSKDIPLAGKLVKAESLPGGEFFFRGPHELPIDKLSKVFGQKPEFLYEATSHLNAKHASFGDASVEMLALPRVPLVFIVWAGDEQFPARCSILFDQTASEQLLLDALMAVVELATKSIIRALE